ncbi:MAG: hypothetical protein HKM93_21225 [Desulfobacteraceae bacterium]|nr:hypothetical protein [Desulfobacteraceae bacterium]
MGYINNHVNVYNTCLRIMRSRGYKLRVDGELDQEELIKPGSLIWYAEKGRFSAMAENPLELLGLTSIYEFKMPTTDESYWWVVEGEDIFNELMEKAFLE